MQTSITHSITAIKPHFEAHQIVLWREANIPVPGVVVTADDEQQQALIRVRTLRGDVQTLTVSYSEIEVRA